VVSPPLTVEVATTEVVQVHPHVWLLYRSAVYTHVVDTAL
jgi:hypothetical protein